MNAWVLMAAVAAYGAALFAIARAGDRRAAGRRGLPKGLIYALSLGVYFTSWTYFGAVGTAVRSGWGYLAVFVGPILAVTLLYPLWTRVAAAAKRVNAGSIADFLAARYGRSRGLGALVAVVAVVGSLPYIALQLKSLSTGWALLTMGRQSGAPADATVLVIAMLLAGFAILFGARRADLTAHNRGLVEAMAFESIVKLGGLVVAALIAAAVLWQVHTDIRPLLGALAEPPLFDARFLVVIFLSTVGLFCVPRQFHMGFVELIDTGQTGEIRRTLPIYFTATLLCVIPIVAGSALVAPLGADPDLLVLDMPLRAGGQVMTVLVFLGGFSAATAMVIVEAVALSAMISNELVLPLAAHRLWRAKAQDGDVSGAILLVRRGAIVGILLLAWLYCLQLNPGEMLASIGATAFAAAAQFAPALIAAVTWKRGTASGAIAGIGSGFAAWLYTLLLPQLGWSATPTWLGQGDPVVVGTVWSLGLNTFLLIVVSLLTPSRLAERVQADLFMGLNLASSNGVGGALVGRAGDLRDLMVRFLGAPAAQRSFSDLAIQLGQPLNDDDPVSPQLAREVERRLAGAIGSSSAQGVIAVALSGDSRGPEDVKRLLDEAAQAVQFSRDLLQSALDNVEQGISVIDADLRLMAWNDRYLEMFNFPPNFIHVGKPIEDVLRFNAERGEWADGDPAERIARRLRALRRRAPHSFERERRDGSVLRCVGAAIPGGGYVTTFTDITEHRRREDGLAAGARALEEANLSLERRVEARTADLKVAIAEAEAANASKSRFLAAASHDLLQPLHAARLFVAALAEEQAGDAAETRRLASQADRSIAAADGLLRALLNLAKLEAGKVQPAVRPIALGPLLCDLHREFLPIAADKGLTLRLSPTAAWVQSDRDLLRSLLQNLIGNAIAYTAKGGVLVGVRRDGAMLRVEVWDTGPGVPDHSREAIFKDFSRGESAIGTPGMGLGLAIVERVANLLGHPVGLRSSLGRGSVFSVAMPRAKAKPAAELSPRRSGALGGMRVLCVDDEQAILDSMVALVTRWGGVVDTARSFEEAEALPHSWSAALVDYHLGSERTGLDLIARLGPRLGHVALVTAETNEELLASARAVGLAVLNKPLQPAVLRTFLSGAMALAAE